MVILCQELSQECKVEPLLRGHPDERSTPLERPLDKKNLNINVLISTPDKRPPLLKGHISAAKWVALQEGFHCIPYPSILEHGTCGVRIHYVTCSAKAAFYMISVVEMDLKSCLCHDEILTYSIKLLRDGKVVRASTSLAVGCGFMPQPGHTKDHHKYGTHCLPHWHAGIRVGVW